MVEEPPSYHNQLVLMLHSLPSSLHLPRSLLASLHHSPGSFQIKENKEKCKCGLCGTSAHSCRALERSLGEKCPGTRHERSLLPCTLADPGFTPTMMHLPGVAPGLCLPPWWPSSPAAAPQHVGEHPAPPQDPAAVPITHLRCRDSAGRSPSPQFPCPPDTTYDMNITKVRTSFSTPKLKNT